MAASSVGVGPVQRSSDEDLSICPICFGYTTIKDNKVYCPNDKLFISDNPADALRTKVRYIKADVDTIKQKQVAKSEHRIARSLVTGVILAIVVVVLVLAGLAGYELVQAKGYEASGQYALAATAYQNSEYLVKLPTVDDSISRMKQLEISETNYNLGQQAMQLQNWTLAVQFFGRVDPSDNNYPQALAQKQQAELKLQGVGQ